MSAREREVGVVWGKSRKYALGINDKLPTQLELGRRRRRGEHGQTWTPPASTIRAGCWLG